MIYSSYKENNILYKKNIKWEYQSVLSIKQDDIYMDRNRNIKK